MTPDDWQKLSSVLDQVLDLSDIERGSFLAKLRVEDPQLCTEIESLLKQQKPTHRLEAPPADLLNEITVLRTPDAKPPDQLGGYHIIKVLGAGGMGVVYEAEDPTLERRVALKVMKGETALLPDARERFLREARAVAALHHDHILPIYHVGVEAGVVFLVMPLLQGETLEDHLRRTPNPLLLEILRVGREIAEGLAAAHARNLIHRDIKPANIWLENKDEGRRMKDEPGKVNSSFIPHPSSFRVKIMDFGLARRTTTDASLTQSGMILGTPVYMSPEQGRGEELDGRSDLFSLGCVLYRMGTGTPPFQRNDALSTVVAAATETPTPPSEANPSIPVAVSNLILKLLAKAPADRFGSAREVADRLNSMEDTGAFSTVRTPRPAAATPGLSTARVWRLWVLAMGLLVPMAACIVAHAIYSSRPNYIPPLDPEQKIPGKQDPPAAFLPIKQWLAKKTKEQILTVAQDGSGMYQSIGAALDALKQGQVVQVLDKGPYREDLRKMLPENVGLVSEVGTRLELTVWHRHFEGPTGFFYHCADFKLEGGARFHGFEIVGPELPTDNFYAALVMVQVRGDVIVESCRLLHRPAYSLERPTADAYPASFFTALHVDGTPQRASHFVARRLYVEGSVVLSRFAVAPLSSTIEENFVLGWRQVGIALDSQSPGSAVIRNNVIFSNTNAIGFGPLWQNSGYPVTITNNLLDQPMHPLSIDQTDLDALKLNSQLRIPSNVRFQNNLIASTQARGIEIPTDGLAIAKKHWKLGHNAYRADPGAPTDLGRHASDLIQANPYLSEDPKQPMLYKRTAADGPLATQGAGGDLPRYIGPFPPGPAPKDGDWFTRLLTAK